MIVIIAISGIITCGAIISAKYYYIEDIDDVWSLLVRFTRWRVKRKKNSVFPVDDKKEITATGKDVAHAVDFLFVFCTDNCSTCNNSTYSNYYYHND
jgi:hypothetical protein